MRAKIAHFYGWTDREIRRLPYDTFLDYLRSIMMIEAQKAILDIKISSYPHFSKKSAQTKLMRLLAKQSKQDLDTTDGKRLTLAEMAQHLAGSMRGN